MDEADQAAQEDRADAGQDPDPQSQKAQDEQIDAPLAVGDGRLRHKFDVRHVCHEEALLKGKGG